MEGSTRIQGRDLSPGDIEHIRGLLASHPQWSRRRLSQRLCEDWDWRHGSGVLEDMAARALLLKLEQRGLVQLPQRRQAPTNRMRIERDIVDEAPLDTTPISAALSALQPPSNKRTTSMHDSIRAPAQGFRSRSPVEVCAAALLGIALATASDAPRAAAVTDIDFIGGVTLADTGSIAGLGGLSDLAYNADDGLWYLLSDEGRMFSMTLDLSDGYLDPGDAALVAEEPLALTGTDDPEGLDIGTDGTWWIGAEGNANANDANGGGYEPFVADVDPASGDVIEELPLPVAYDPIAPNGIRHNHGFESVALAADGAGIYTAAEEGLSQDELPGGSSALTRVLLYGLTSKQPVSEYAYLLDDLGIFSLFGTEFQNGLPAMLSIGNDRLLVLERALTVAGYSSRLFEVDLGSADNILGDFEIATDFEAGSIQAAGKTLLRNLSQTDHLNTSNIEGLAFGPWEGLSRTLLLIADDGDPITNNDLYAYRVTFDERFGVPLPTTLSLLLTGLAGLIGALRRTLKPSSGA